MTDPVIVNVQVLEGTVLVQALPVDNDIVVITASPLTNNTPITTSPETPPLIRPYGSSAYEVAVANGFVGSQTDWLISLIGTPGTPGIQGVQGLSADATAIVASEYLPAGSFINIWDSAGAKVRKADATVVGKEAHGFILTTVNNGAIAEVLFTGINNALSGQTPGVLFLDTVAGVGTLTPPSTAGNIVQRLGVVTNSTTMLFQYSMPIILA